METMPLRVFIYGNSEPIAQALQQLLLVHSNLVADFRIGDFPSLNSEAKGDDWEAPHVIVVDQSSLSTSFEQTHTGFRNMGWNAPLIVLDIYHTGALGRAFRLQGASAYLPVDSPGKVLFQAISAVSQGKPYFPLSV